IHAGHLTISVPVGLAVAGLWLVRDRAQLSASGHGLMLGLALLIAWSGAGPLAPFSTCLLLIATLIWRRHRVRAVHGESDVSQVASQR
ncbi:MAG: hypothetical protein AAF184_25075, partial [Pseudomonadota bacterium]